MNTLKTKWTGIRPLIMHNGLLADPTNPYTRKIKEITRKGSKKMTDADHALRDQLEWEGGLYYDEESKKPFIPSDNIERCIQVGAQKSRLGKDVQAAVFVSDDTVFIDFDGPKEKSAMFADPRFTIRKGVVIQKSRLIRIRPMIPTGWKMTFTLEFDDTVINKANLVKAMQDAGSLVGCGDWRPKFGRFLVEVE